MTDRIIKTYKVHISQHHKAIREARNKQEAAALVWDDMKDNWTYYWTSREDFIKRVKVEEI